MKKDVVTLGHEKSLELTRWYYLYSRAPGAVNMPTDLPPEVQRSTRNKKGWLRPFNLALDHVFSGRWLYWGEAMMKKQVPDEPIPQIDFYDPQINGVAQKNLRACLDHHTHNSSTVLDDFLSWILWGLGSSYIEKFPQISDKTDDFWYRTFNLGLLHYDPADHWGIICAERMYGLNGFFPTPMNICQMMVKMIAGDPEKADKTKSFVEPCCGTGTMLLAASNYSLSLSGQDINSTVIKACLVNSYLYIPWVVAPGGFMKAPKRKVKRTVELPAAIQIPMDFELVSNG